ncbi:rho GTPase-activating protein 4-like [Raphanus sativus]|uniref:Rho GTPase-activating protein 4-like n=1 Tax=Raphanus sativus TaxID=3726 RepID=A0A9W3DT38_RAPSA|nr:rho GTPase-activating protein 4-like [Raphanus sativus]
MLDPLTALVYAVQVMNFLKTLIVKTLKERKESRYRLVQASNPGPRDESGDQRSRQLLHLMEANKEEAVDTVEVEMKDKEESEEEEYADGWEEKRKRKMERTMSTSSIVGRVNYRVELFEAWRRKKGLHSFMFLIQLWDFLDFGFVGGLLVYQEMLHVCI